MEAFTQDQVVPDVVDSVPKAQLQVKYGGATVTPGSTFTPTQVKDAPEVTWEADQAAYYTLIMTDPDAPSRTEPAQREMLHWLVTNIPRNDISKGNVLADYVASGPPKGTGFHRYVFLLYKQAGRQEFPDFPIIDRNTSEGRPLFKNRGFAARYALGELQAATFFQAEYDNYVPTIHKQLGMKF